MSHPELAIAGFYDHEQQTERRAPDWGGDDLFTAGPPRRRFERTVYPPSVDTAVHADEPAAETWGEDSPAERAGATMSQERALARYEEPVPEGRRTVTITGRPQDAYVARRPARSLDERIAHRPERIASYACALGFLLILLAVLTAH